MGRTAEGNVPVIQEFQSTHPVWDGTAYSIEGLSFQQISIHPSRVGWDLARRSAVHGAADFNPPIPCGMGRKA